MEVVFQWDGVGLGRGMLNVRNRGNKRARKRQKELWQKPKA